MSTLAFELIQQCLETRNPYLDLGNCGLTDEHFFERSDLNQLLDRCTHVRTLILSNKWWDVEKRKLVESQNKDDQLNTFDSVPPFVFKMDMLESLVFCGDHGNRFGVSDMSFVSNLINLIWLDLSNNRIEKICGLENLTRLQKLDLNSNGISVIRGLENLTALRQLDLGANKISTIKGLKTLTLLKELFLYHNKIKNISGLDSLADLKELYLHGNNIEIITGLDNLKQLKRLNLDANGIKNITGLNGLVDLRYLSIAKNMISSMDGTESNVKLKRIDFRSNQIVKLKNLKNLSALQELVLSNNQITDIKELIPIIGKKGSKLNIVFKDYETKINEINLNENPLTSPPIEIAQQGNYLILNYFAELEKRGTEYLYEAKMLIVGQPRAGKTSLRYKLFDSSALLPTEDKTTRGIDIERISFNIIDKEGKDREFHYNVWDFGGQQIYQTTHQFFLTHRSLYILVIDTGKDSIGNDDNTINYWLQALELLGGRSPLLLVRNEKNERQVYIDFPQKQARFNFLKSDYNLDLNALIPDTATFNLNQSQKFALLKEDIETELKRLPLVGFPMPKNWVEIRNELQSLSTSNQYIIKRDFIEICKKYDVVEYNRQMELSRIFHDLGVFLHFQDYGALEDFIILQNTWATDAVFAVFDNKEIQTNKGKFSDADLSEIWKQNDYNPSVHKKLLALMMQFELCYHVDKSSPNIYIIPEMLSDNPPSGYKWQVKGDLPVQYRYDFMPKGILTRLIVRMHKQIAEYNGQQTVWKTGVKIDGTFFDCLNTTAEITEAWNNKQLDIKVQGPFAKDLMSKITFQVDELNNEFFRQVGRNDQEQKSRWYKMIPCNCISCKDNQDKHFYDYSELLERKEYGKETIECKKKPFANANIAELIDGVFLSTKNVVKSIGNSATSSKENQTITIFLASSSELKEERKEFEIFINRENKRFRKKGFFLNIEIWEDFLDAMSQTRLQAEYNKVIKNCDIFVMLYFTKVGKYTAEEFESAFRQFKETDSPKIYTYFKKANIQSTDINRRDITSLLDFQEKIKELGHFQTEFENDATLHLHFKKQLELLYNF